MKEPSRKARGAADADFPRRPSARSRKCSRRAADCVAEIYVDDKLRRYIVSLVTATREPAKKYGDKPGRAGYRQRRHRRARRWRFRCRCAKALAWPEQEAATSRPHHIQTVAPDILRHRIIPSFEAEADNVSRGDIVKLLLEVVAVP